MKNTFLKVPVLNTAPYVYGVGKGVMDGKSERITVQGSRIIAGGAWRSPSRPWGKLFASVPPTVLEDQDSTDLKDYVLLLGAGFHGYHFLPLQVSLSEYLPISGANNHR